MKKAIDIHVNMKTVKNVRKKLSDLRKFSELQFQYEIHKAGLNIAADIKRPPIPVDTGNLRNNVVYNTREKAIESKAPYSGFLEFGTKFQKAQPYFYSKINTGLKRLVLDLNNAITRALR